jgi:putative endonuclease
VFFAKVSLFLLNPDPPQFKQLRETSETQHLCPLNPTYRAGMTSNLVRRMWQHKNNITPGFTKRYNVKTLVYFEVHDNAQSGISREKRIKKWQRTWKLELIEKKNPGWKDLHADITHQASMRKELLSSMIVCSKDCSFCYFLDSR